MGGKKPSCEELERRISELEAELEKKAQAEQELRETNERLQAIFEHSPAGIALTTLEGDIISVNRAVMEKMGYSLEELRRRNASEFYQSPRDREELLEKVRRDGSIHNHEISLRAKDGSTFIGLVNMASVQAHNDKYLLTMIEDITGRKLAEEALYEKQELTQTLLDNLTSVVVVKDAAGRYLLVNRKAAEVIGKNSQEIIGKTPFDLYPREIAANIHADDMQVIRTGKVVVTEERLRLDDDRIYFTTKVPFFTRDGKPKGLCGLATDITERKLAEKALRESEARLQAIFNSAAIGIALSDPGGRFIQVNRHLLELLGYGSQAELFPKAALDITHPEDREASRKMLQDMAAGRIDSFRLEKRYLRRDGSFFWGDLSVSSIRGRDGSIVAQVGVIVDISERKQAEQALRESEEHFRALAENVTDIIVRLDENMRCLYVNPAITRFTGLPTEHYTGRSIREVGLSDKNLQLWEKQFRKVLELGEPVGTIYELELNAEKLQFDWRLIPEFDSQGRLVTLLSTSRDITAIRQLEEERAKLSKLESIGVLAGGIAHDFNNILTAVLGNISLVRMLTSEEKIIEYLVEAEKAALRAKDLTRQLLTFSKGGHPVKKVCALGQLIKDSAEFAIRGSNVKSEYLIAEDLWLVEVDEGQISQVINNLVINADQAMPDGGSLRLRAENLTIKAGLMPVLEEGRYVKIAIQDSGIGIPAELLPKIFDPYFTTKQTGSGLGLTTSHSIIQKHGGRIQAESILGMGTTFYIYLPASLKAPGETMALRPETSGQAARILVMDDEPVVLDVASKMLAHIGHQVEVAEEGGLAVEMYRNAGRSGRPFDVVILDLTIKGGMGGREALEKLIEIDPGVKAIVSSGYSNDPVLADFRKYGFRGIVAKPYRIEELKQILTQVIKE